MFSTYVDADGDGASNKDDSCPYQPHEPFGTHDADFDFLHSQCDPDDSPDEEGQPANNDQDEDGVQNLDDNCSLAGNEDQADKDQDFIGDACDENRSLNDPLLPGEKDGLGQLGVLPKDGTYPFSVFTVGQRDADNDGYQNSLDTCPLVPNAGNPTIPDNGDSDGDGLDSVCDPNDDPANAGAKLDEDGDGYLNRQDNCPLVANGRDQTDEAGRNQQDPDLDSIGTACDSNPRPATGSLFR
jgi:thrombospondin 2/3/4/5